jgi:predicted ATP-dependent endonuclease of OLD family
VVIDEPEIYLHADLQRQLLGFLRNFEADILLATHSTEIMGEADPQEMVFIDKRNKAAERLKNVEKLQHALTNVGSVHNISLSRLARSRRVVFFEGDSDFKLLRMFARKLGFSGIASGLEIFPAQSDGFGSWEKVAHLGWGIAKALDSNLLVGAVFDRDYFSDAQILKVESKLNSELRFSHIHSRKEIENYLLLPNALQRALFSAVHDKAKREEIASPAILNVEQALKELTEAFRVDVFSQRISREVDHRRSHEPNLDPSTLQNEALRKCENVWANFEQRLTIVPGRAVLRQLRERIAEIHGVSLTDAKIIDHIKQNDVPPDLIKLLEKLERFRIAQIEVSVGVTSKN